MPMFKARALCPHAVIIPPDMAKYVAVSRQIRTLMDELTPLVQPLSIDEAVLDLAGTQALHHAPPAVVLNRFARRVETEIGVSVSIGLGPNRLLAKLAAERGKPRGFFAFGAEAASVLAPEPVGLLPGIGPALAKKLNGLGLMTLGQLAALDIKAAIQRLGPDGPALAARARGEDARMVNIDRESKSISAETTFSDDLTDAAALESSLWRLSEKLGARLRGEDLAAAGIVLKLKTALFQSRTRSARLPNPTQLPETLFEAARALLAREVDGTAFRLIGIGAAPLVAGGLADRGDLADVTTARRLARQAAIDKLRTRFGKAAIGHGRALPKTPPAK
jgi:DNA polymerase-4